jgi:[ribosomal protein S5]-alanine N-acetyltransferase
MPAFDTLTLRTERLRLRALRAEDAAALFAISSDPEVMRCWSTPPWPSAGEAHTLIARDARELPAGEHVRLGIERHEDGRLIGACSLFALVKPCRRAELGYGLSRTAWGRGHMHEALCALLGFGFDELGLNPVEADIDPRNQPSARSFDRPGFRKEGHLRERWIVDGEVSDSVLYGLLGADWRRTAGRARS